MHEPATTAPIPVADDGEPAQYSAVIFTSVRRGDDESGYADAADRMDSLARDQPGYIGIESARGDDGFGITVSYWRTEADAAAWKQVAEHVGVQRLGRERWYAQYLVRVATVHRSYAWRRGDD
jgi:heme-degrading monooxygenase HmoA